MLGIYIRRSVESEESDSIANQLREGKAFADNKGLRYKLYDEGEGISGAAPLSERPALAHLLRDIKKKRISSVWCRNQNRLTRSQETLIIYMATAKKHKVTTYFGDQEFNLTDPNVKLMVGVLGQFNEYEIDLQSAQTTKAIADNFREGKSHGRTPYGYAVDSNKNYILHPENSLIITDIFRMSAEGMSTSVIARKLNARGIKPYRGSEWNRSSIRNILKNTMYYGERKYKETKVSSPQIISRELFDKSMLTLKQNAVTKGEYNKFRFYLNDSLRCANCGNRYLGIKTSKYPYYMCTTKRDDPKKCNSKNITASFLDWMIWKVMISTHSHLEQALLIAQEDSGEKELKERLDAIEKGLEELDAREERQTILFSKGRTKPELLEKIQNDIDNERMHLTSKKGEIETELRAYENPDIDELAVLEGKELPNQMKSELVKKFVYKILIHGTFNAPWSKIDIIFRFNKIKFSYYFNPKKGYLMSSDYALLFITGKGLINKFNKMRAIDPYRWYLTDLELSEVHERIMEEKSEGYAPLHFFEDGRLFDIYEATIDPKAFLNDKTKEDYSARSTEILNENI